MFSEQGNVIIRTHSAIPPGTTERMTEPWLSSRSRVKPNPYPLLGRSIVCKVMLDAANHKIMLQYTIN